LKVPVTAACDLVIVGSGLGGSILSMVARRLGRRVVLLERGRHPRFAIGESSSPLAGLLIEQIAARYDLPRLAPLGSYGTWQRHYPQLRCGLKRGFTYYKHEAGRPFVPTPDHASELLVAASPNDELGDLHWLRADVDAWLVEEAAALGVAYLDDCRVDGVELRDDGATVRGERHGVAVTVEAHGLVDATGPRGCLHRALGLADEGFAGYPGTQALFSHFEGVRRTEDLPAFGGPARAGATPPYPVDDAALHHVFDGGWMWVLRFAHGVTSAGVAVTDAFANELRIEEGEPAWRRLLDRFPSIRAQFEDAVAIRRFDLQPRLSYRASVAAGARWAMLPSAAAFIDPLFSTGFPMTLLGIERLGRLMEAGAFGRAHSAPHAAALDDYARTTLREADHTARFIAGCYAAFPRFAQFTAYSMFYFAAASYAEAFRRLGSGGEGLGFLGAANRDFADALARLSPATVGPARTPAESRRYADEVAAAIEPLNVAGLCRPDQRNWYGVDNDDLLAGAGKLGVSRADVERLLASLGLDAGDVPQRSAAIVAR
jgi:FADH2 O2-dependent halogenase